MSQSENVIRIHSVVWGILAQLPEGVTEPISNTEFRKAMLAIKDRNPSLFREMVFDTHTSAPWSPVIEYILFIMGHSRLLQRSPLDDRWHLLGVAAGFKQNYAQYFTPEELKVLEREGKDLAEKVARGELAPVRIS